MDNVLRKFGLRKADLKESEARIKIQKELFHFQKGSDHGFPRTTSCISYSPHLDMIALGTKDGFLKIYGAPGECYCSQLPDQEAIEQVFFIGELSKAVTYSEDNRLHFWLAPPHNHYLTHHSSLSLDSKINQPSTFLVSRDFKHLYIGGENGNIYAVSLNDQKISPIAIFKENVTKNYFEGDVSNVGKVVAIRQHEKNKMLIAYEKGLIALYNTSTKTSLNFYKTSQVIESMFLKANNRQFITTHANGSYSVWRVDRKKNQSGNRRVNEPHTTTPYGPFPCKSIKKLITHLSTPAAFDHTTPAGAVSKQGPSFDSTVVPAVGETEADEGCENDDEEDDAPNTRVDEGCGGNAKEDDVSNTDEMLVFSGGMPRSTFGDRHTVTVMQGEKHVVFEVTTKVLDFVLINKPQALALFILAEHEFVAIDLSSPNWPCFRLPYLAILHSSAFTCLHVVEEVDDDMLEALRTNEDEEKARLFSEKAWPLEGHLTRSTAPHNANKHTLLFTGHENGSVKVWEVTKPSEVTYISQFNTCGLFQLPSEAGEDDADFSDWPPFRKVGTYDPYSDDPRLVIKKIDFCTANRVLVVAGAAGQVVVASMKGDTNNENNNKNKKKRRKAVRMSFIDERSRNYSWKGHEAMSTKKTPQSCLFNVECIAQAYPPAAFTAITVCSNWRLIAVGTEHGFAVVDYQECRLVEIKCTVKPSDLSGGNEGMSRRKSFKKSLRESFRRLRSRRSKSVEKKLRKTMQAAVDIDAPKPIERAVEARSPDDVTASVVKSLYFAETYLINATSLTATFWAGTNAGVVYIHQLVVPEPSLRNDEEVISSLAKEVHLRHHAPVLSIDVIERPPEKPSESTTHNVVICSEEQVKVFSLPSLSAKEKYKMTAHEGAKIRKTAICRFNSKSDSAYSEKCLMLTTNLGETHVFSIPFLRRQIKAQTIRKDNILGMVTCALTKQASVFYANSSSEVSTYSLSASRMQTP